MSSKLWIECSKGNDFFSINIGVLNIFIYEVVGIDKKVLVMAREKAGEFEERLNFQRMKRVNAEFARLMKELCGEVGVLKLE